eukprot:TRINITY_DN4835_c0_g1_i1.p1 TRINITY_DN4835_c0_g1~~TRINITY_DN4835_c0_g1_i1.p1  ORF type:complete len:201 (+),score=26.02 TRINITY_DN4835_c0_g1_i1:453-1055(+)
MVISAAHCGGVQRARNIGTTTSIARGAAVEHCAAGPPSSHLCLPTFGAGRAASSVRTHRLSGFTEVRAGRMYACSNLCTLLSKYGANGTLQTTTTRPRTWNVTVNEAPVASTGWLTMHLQQRRCSRVAHGLQSPPARSPWRTRVDSRCASGVQATNVHAALRRHCLGSPLLPPLLRQRCGSDHLSASFCLADALQMQWQR